MESIQVKEDVGIVFKNDLIETYSGKSFNKSEVNVFRNELNFENYDSDHMSFALAGMAEGISFVEIAEGKISLLSENRGLLKVNLNALMEFNNIDKVLMTILHKAPIVNEGTVIAEINIIPSAYKKEIIKEIKKICRDYYPVISVKSFNNLKAGIITAGNEFNYKPVKEKIIPVLNKKFNKLRCMVTGLLFSKNEPEKIAESVKSLAEMGAEVIVITADIYNKPGNLMLMDIHMAEADTANVMPEPDFLISYAGNIPVVVLPNHTIDAMTTAFDTIIPRLAAGEKPAELRLI